MTGREHLSHRWPENDNWVHPKMTSFLFSKAQKKTESTPIFSSPGGAEGPYAAGPWLTDAHTLSIGTADSAFQAAEPPSSLWLNPKPLPGTLRTNSYIFLFLIENKMPVHINSTNFLFHDWLFSFFNWSMINNKMGLGSWNLLPKHFKSTGYWRTYDK